MTPTNLPASIRARLRNLAERDRIDFGAILTRYALERMLYRISIGEHRDEFLLKGALLFDVWFGTPSRPTRDIDLLGFGPADSQRIGDVFRAACTLDFPDGIVFAPDTVTTADIRKEAGYPGIRVTMQGDLDGALMHVQVDVGFGDAVTPQAMAVTFPVLLEELPSPVLNAYPKPTVIAERFHSCP
ncbi:MAG: nucleotidyl transferase AbiEii/AbiGii toxin family protein [Candidatus Nanopelagicales bacterium]